MKTGGDFWRDLPEDPAARAAVLLEELVRRSEPPTLVQRFAAGVVHGLGTVLGATVVASLAIGLLIAALRPLEGIGRLQDDVRALTDVLRNQRQTPLR